MYELVPRGLRSWHAGKSIHAGREYCNNWTVGYEIVAAPQVDPEAFGYTDAQYEAAADLARRDMQEGGFGPDMIVGHDEIRANWNAAHPDDPGAAKHDPGPTWDWERFRALLQAT